MLSSEIIRKIEQFVHEKPRTVQEIAELTGKNWRTADRYVDEIETEFGTIAKRTFREGTRGALKIVYWAGLEGRSASVFQQELEKEIANCRKKDHFYAFDIYQYVATNKKHVEISSNNKDVKQIYDNIGKLLLSAKKQIISFSGDLSFMNAKFRKGTLFDVFDKLASKGVSIKVICRVDIVGSRNVEKLMNLNKKYGKEIIEIRHREQPLRGVIVDNKIARLKEIRYADETIEMKDDLYLYYTFVDNDWINWLKRIFQKMYSSSVIAKKRLDEIDLLKAKNIMKK